MAGGNSHVASVTLLLPWKESYSDLEGKDTFISSSYDITTITSTLWSVHHALGMLINPLQVLFPFILTSSLEDVVLL